MGQQALVTLPQHINSGNASQIREQLLWIINRGAAGLIADLTGTLSCDFSGADALARAYHRAMANGTELRLVVTADVVRRVLALNGLDRLVAIYPDLDGALAAGAERRQVHGEPGTQIGDHGAPR
jgi:anti-anti-sigma factor